MKFRTTKINSGGRVLVFTNISTPPPQKLPAIRYSRLSLIWMGAFTFIHIGVDSSQTVLEHHRSFTPVLVVHVRTSGLCMHCYSVLSGVLLYHGTLHVYTCYCMEHTSNRFLSFVSAWYAWRAYCSSALSLSCLLI